MYPAFNGARRFGIASPSNTSVYQPGIAGSARQRFTERHLVNQVLCSLFASAKAIKTFLEFTTFILKVEGTYIEGFKGLGKRRLYA